LRVGQLIPCPEHSIVTLAAPTQLDSGHTLLFASCGAAYFLTFPFCFQGTPCRSSDPMTILVTGGAGFIGSNFVLDWLEAVGEAVVNLDALTYAGNLHNLDAIKTDPRHTFVQGDIGERTLVERLLAEHRPRAVLHFAAESHVDRSIHGPGE
jgi:hypothetical protein